MNKLIHKNKSLIERFLIILFLFTSHQCIAAAPRDEFFISSPDKFPVDVITNLETLLTKFTGKPWTAKKDQPVECGFYLSLKESGNYKTGESCQIISNGKGLVQFQAPTINGLIFGVYRYLRDMRFAFYLPDELYTILPNKAPLFEKSNYMVTPHLRIREFFGTGGFGSGLTDTDMSVKKDWQLWMWQNGFGAEFQLDGHVGESFNLDNADILEKNPTWTASPIKTNGKVNVSTKLNYFNPAAVDFFTDWVIRKFTDKNYKPSASYIRDMVSIDPADGGGFKEGTAIVKNVQLNTVSDQVFFAANEAAKKLDKLFPNYPNIGVNLYAYSNHADVPNFKLNPRVFVQIIPYQFQNIAFGPAFIKRWSEKVTRFGLYDYFKYPDSHHDMPGGYTLDQLMTRAMHAGNAGSEGTTYESSYSKFATAIPLWVLIRYMADGDKNWENQYNNLIKELYGEAAPNMQNLFKLFYRQSTFDIADYKTAYAELEKASNLTKNSTIKKRLEELKLYLTYTQLYSESQNNETGNLEQRLLPVFKMAWTLYEKKIIHSYREMQLVSYTFLNTPGPDAATTERYKKLHLRTFPDSDDKDAFWRSPSATSMYSNKELLILYEKYRNNSLASTETPNSSNLSVSDIITESKNLFKPVSQIRVQGNSYGRGYFYLYTDKPTTLNIDYTLLGDNPSPALTISGTDKTYKNVYDEILNNKTGKLNINIPAGVTYLFTNSTANTTYRLKVQLNGAWVYFEPSPRGKMAFIDSTNEYYYTPSIYPTYFFVPKDVTEVRYKVQVNSLKIITPDHQSVPNKLEQTLNTDFEIRSFKVEPQHRGKFWQGIVSGNFNYELLNIPDVWYMLEPK